MKEVSILIPARAGSKRIPNKNVVDICGRPMIEYCIEESLRVTDKVYVSTDCSKIKKVCAGYKEVTVIDRPAHLATDESTTNSVIAHFLEGRDIGVFTLVQATSPLIQASHLESGLNKFIKGEYDTVISAYKTVQFYWSPDGRPKNFDPSTKKRTQDMEEWYVENGAFYITTKENFYKNNNLVGKQVGFTEMSKSESIDIDDHEDLELARSILYYKKRKQK